MFVKAIKISSLLLVCLLLLGQPASVWAATDTVEAQTETSTKKLKTTEVGTPLESLNVSYWPEYDDPSVLVMYRGKVNASVKTPATIKIAIPKGKGTRVVATSAVDPNGQFQYDEAWNSKQLVDLEDMTILTYKTIYPEFQFEIYTQNVSGRGKRNFDFSLPSISNIKTLNVDIKKPVRAENFKATPAAASTKAEGEFENHYYSYSDVVPGLNYSFNVTYDRADSNPSVDKQTGVVDTSGGSSQTALILIFMVGLTVLLVGAGVWRAKAASSAAPTKGRPVKAGQGKGKGKGKNKGRPISAAKPAGAKAAAKFCPDCGTQVTGGSKFCADCGASL